MIRELWTILLEDEDGVAGALGACATFLLVCVAGYVLTVVAWAVLP